MSSNSRYMPSLLLGAAASLLLVGAASDAGTPQPTKVSWRVPEADLANGEAIAQTCMTCHQAGAPRLDPPTAKLYRQRRSYVFFALLEFKDGTRENALMQPFVDPLSEQDMRDVAAYIAGEELNQPPRARTDLPGYAKAVRDCAWCHGETGIGELEGMPILTGQDPEYLKAALAEFLDGTRKEPTMSSVIKDVDPADFDDLVEYYAAHEWLEHNP